MSANQWIEIWDSRGSTTSPVPTEGGRIPLPSLIDLLHLDGFDVGAGAIEEASWVAYARYVGERLHLEDGSRVFEIGCGAGAFLMALQQRWRLSVGGSDFAPGLLAVAKSVMPEGSFFLADATQPPPEAMSTLVASSDAVVMNGVLHYFPSLDEVETLIGWLAPLTSRVALLEIPDASTADECEADRSSALPEGDYERLYTRTGLRHLYVDREELRTVVERYGFTVETEDQAIDGYRQSRFRFNAFLTR